MKLGADILGKRCRDSTLKATAYHEAGHAVIAWSLRLLRKPGASIVRDVECSGRTHMKVALNGRPDMTPSNRMRLRAENLAISWLAGMEAQRKFNARSLRSYHGHKDYDDTLNLMEYFSSSDDEAAAYVQLLGIRAKPKVEQFWDLIGAVAAELLVRKTLSRSEIEQILQSRIVSLKKGQPDL